MTNPGHGPEVNNCNPAITLFSGLLKRIIHSLWMGTRQHEKEVKTAKLNGASFAVTLCQGRQRVNAALVQHFDFPSACLIV